MGPLLVLGPRHPKELVVKQHQRIKKMYEKPFLQKISLDKQSYVVYFFLYSPILTLLQLTFNFKRHNVKTISKRKQRKN